MSDSVYDWEEEEEWKLVNRIEHVPGQLSFNLSHNSFFNKENKENLNKSIFDEIIKNGFKDDPEYLKDLIALASVMDIEWEDVWPEGV